MDQDRTVAKVLRDLIAAGLIDEKRSGEMRQVLNQVYAAGWEEQNGNLADSRSLIVHQCDREGKLIKEYRNILTAARKAKYSRNTIFRSLKTGETTRRGHIWKYAP